MITREMSVAAVCYAGFYLLVGAMVENTAGQEPNAGTIDSLEGDVESSAAVAEGRGSHKLCAW